MEAVTKYPSYIYIYICMSEINDAAVEELCMLRDTADTVKIVISKAESRKYAHGDASGGVGRLSGFVFTL